jgi:hypothetical protein
VERHVAEQIEIHVSTPVVSRSEDQGVMDNPLEDAEKELAALNEFASALSGFIAQAQRMLDAWQHVDGDILGGTYPHYLPHFEAFVNDLLDIKLQHKQEKPAEADPWVIRERAISIIGEDRVPADVLAQLIQDFGSED